MPERFYLEKPDVKGKLEKQEQKYLDEVTAIIGLDMAVPGVYLHWNQEEIDQRIRFMKRMRRLNDLGLLFWYPLSRRGLNRNEIKQQHLMKNTALKKKTKLF